jgi:elongation factor Ts
MASFTAKDVAALRAKTGCGMMDCKKALTDANGDTNVAIDLLREKGLAAATKKSGRIAAEGVAFAKTNVDSTIGVVIEVNAETDFVAKNADFLKFVETCADTVIEKNPANLEELLSTAAVGSEFTVEQLLQDKVLTIGENIKIRRFERRKGDVATYIHAGGRIGVMVKFETTNDIAANDEFKAYAKDIAMQVAASNPNFLDENSVPEETKSHEIKILTEQIINEGKPENIAEKIVQGKMKKYYKENCLLDQAFVKDSDVSVLQHTQNIAKSLGGDIKVVDFIRFEKGEGIEKREDNFADEVAGMIK